MSNDTTPDICGSTDTTTGEPCQFKPGTSCPWHDTKDTPDTGRPTKLTRERQEGICQAIENGKSVTSAARMNGITPAAVYVWLERGEEQDEGIYNEFFERFVRARGHGEDYYVQSALDIAKSENDLATLMSMLKQRYPESWGDVDRGEQESNTDIVIEREVVTNQQAPDLEE